MGSGDDILEIKQECLSVSYGGHQLSLSDFSRQVFIFGIFAEVIL